VSYAPRSLPPELKENVLAKWLAEELRLIANQFNLFDIVGFAPYHAAPTRPREGMMVYADGSDWDPGEGEGIYFYDGGAWVAGFNTFNASELGVAKCLVRVTVSGGTITHDTTTDLNIDSVTDDGAGLITVAWDVNFATAAYFPFGISQGLTGAVGVRGGVNAPVAGSTKFVSRDAAGTATDPECWFIIAWGAQ
jgi:hypothetical protein